ncbi:hypothetical protein [uncultured Shimia sp.]|uniref:hypothetical protein n=1 Tax=uncultured Shimia sp. TaxID=573152 RepID=UPI0026175BF1|nr:hypothetical protein [uncultured Shimia sp.]
MHDFFSEHFGPGGDHDRIFAWLWIVFSVGFVAVCYFFGISSFFGWEVPEFSFLVLIGSGFATVLTLLLFLVFSVVEFVLKKLERSEDEEFDA